MIALIDYKAGNLTSVRKALAAVGAEVYTPEQPEDLSHARGIIVPGVGHFGSTRALDRSWMSAIEAHITAGRPLLGICLGMQWLYESSEEAPDLPGLGYLRGACRRLRPPAGCGDSSAGPPRRPILGQWRRAALSESDRQLLEGPSARRSRGGRSQRI